LDLNIDKEVPSNIKEPNILKKLIGIPLRSC